MTAKHGKGPGPDEGQRPARRGVVLTHLRDRLFDLTRRNPLLHFRATARTLNLTQASVPLVLDVRSIRPAQLFTWGGPASAKLVEGGVETSTCDCSSSRSAAGRRARAAAWNAATWRRGVPRVAASARKYSSSMPNW